MSNENEKTDRDQITVRLTPQNSDKFWRYYEEMKAKITAGGPLSASSLINGLIEKELDRYFVGNGK